MTTKTGMLAIGLAKGGFQSPTRTSVSGTALKPTGVGGEVRLGYWSHRRRWEDADDMGGGVKPLDEALQFIATTDIFWPWT